MSTKPEVKFGKITNVEDGKSYRLHYRPNGTAAEYEVCCDCNLVHLVEYKPGKRSLRIRVWRDEEKTEALRKRSKS